MSVDIPKAVVLLSGGMDSTVLVHLLDDEGYLPCALSVHYGQRHSVELHYAKQTTEDLGISHAIIDLANVRDILGKSALTSSTPVPEGHYAAENMATTVVPNRNAFLLSLAYGYAITRGAVKVCTAVHKGDHAIYPDCRPEFIKAFEEMERTAITREIYGTKAPDLYAPFVNLTKAEICAIGGVLEVDWKKTWSCYQGEKKHCGRCGTCVERIEAFKLANLVDPTEYLDSEFASSILESNPFEEKFAKATNPDGSVR